MLSAAAGFQIAGAFLILVGVARKLPAAPDSSQALVATVLIIAGTVALLFGIYKADLHPTWFKIGGVMLFFTGFVGTNVNPPGSPQHEIASLLFAVGAISFIEGWRKARAVRLAAMKAGEDESSDSRES
jgi:hypothetical protein